MSAAITQYIAAINAIHKEGNVTEASYRTPLQVLLKSYCHTNQEIIHEPQRIAGTGAPDFILQDKLSKGSIFYLETKDIGDSDLLGNNKNKEQFSRYKKSCPYCIFTDYLNFVFYHDGTTTTVRLADTTAKGIKANKAEQDQFTHQIQLFFTLQTQPITNPAQLAERMAGNARLLADIVLDSLNSTESEDDEEIEYQKEIFQQALLHGITNEEFADIYAQTIIYGMLAAKLKHGDQQKPFTRIEVGGMIPTTNRFIRRFFNANTGHEIHPKIEWLVDSTVALFAQTDIDTIMAKIGEQTRSENPIIHFYETFLSEYNPAQRKGRGVWFTPQPIVQFIVRAVDDILKADFNLAKGLADTSKITQELPIEHSTKKQIVDVHKVQLLDPATGTGTFLAQVIQHIHTQMPGQQGSWSNYVEEHLLPRLNGFELLMASYAMAHIQLDFLLRKTGYQPKTPQRFRVYLTNSLEESLPKSGSLAFAPWLIKEVQASDNIKRNTPVMVVLGNPPYSGESANKGDWIKILLNSYKQEPDNKGKLQEKNPKWLNDDYVKFIRLAEHYIEKNQHGIIAFINPHGFLDNPTFRGMRWQLLTTFDKIYTLDLHGNSNKKEKSPDGSPDENVFDIMQGVSINLFIKTGQKQQGDLAQVFHYDLYGKREDKYNFLEKTKLQDITFNTVENKAPLYFMVPKNYTLQAEYEQGFAVTDLFATNSVGIVTARDDFTVQHTKKEVTKTISKFLSLADEPAREYFQLGEDARDWSVATARQDLIDNYPDKKQGRLCQIAYRPFDNRWTFYTGNSKGFHCMPRKETMQHFLIGDNIGLLFHKREELNIPWSHIFVTKLITEHGVTSSKTTNYQAPLYLYDAEKIDLYKEREPNLKKEIVDKIADKLKLPFVAEKQDDQTTFAPIDILDYIYAVLHSPAYRQKYNQFLKTDFPRVPYPADAKTFWALVAIGTQLRQLHLLENENIPIITQYPVDGSHKVEKIEYKDGKVYINPQQYFGGVPATAWEFYIGGYQPAQKWLKDRKGRTLNSDDITHYQKIITCLDQTTHLQTFL